MDITYKRANHSPPVYIAGTFNNWERQPMEYTRNGSDNGVQYSFFKSVNATVGTHQYKFYIGPFDTGKWLVDETQPTGELCHTFLSTPN